MNNHSLFGLSALMSLVASGVFAKLCIWPRLQKMDRDDAIVSLVVPHMFLRFIGLSFLVPGVVSPSLPAAFAVPAAYGDLVAGILAVASDSAFETRVVGHRDRVGVQRVGCGDLLFGAYQGPHVQIDPGELGAAFFIPTAVVPPLLVTHGLIFWLLLRSKAWRVS